MALHASLQTYAADDNAASVTQAARAILYKMAAQVRNSSSLVTATNSLNITDAAGNVVQYDLAGGQLTYRMSNGTTAVLLGPADEVQVTSFGITKEPLLDANSQPVLDGYGRPACKSLTTCLTFTCGAQTLNVTASSAVRKNQAY